MGNSPFFLTHDLESTAWIGTDALEDIRKETESALKKALLGEVEIRSISHVAWVDFFSEKRQNDEFVITADDGIYIKNPDYAFDSTRMYNNEEGILTNQTSYRILTRDGRPLQSQKVINIPVEKKWNVWLYDDGLFSGDTIKEVLSTLPNGITKYRVTVLLNFSWRDKLGEAPIQALYNGDCTDWIDERDFYYGVKNSWASINPNGIISWVPYISSPRMASKKASIPENKSKEFCLTMLWINQKLWMLINANALLWDVPRLQYLLSRYSNQTPMQDVLEAEKRRVEVL